MEETKEKGKKGRPSRGESKTGCTIKDPLLEPFHIRQDSYNFTVYETSISTRGFAGGEASGKEQEKVVGYYTSFPSALRKIAKEKYLQQKAEYSSIKEYIDTWNKLKTGIETLLKQIEI